jgi:2-polyprenyl-3-methyl-5-hydroxy-6-metoxy-1,4-benzoquinol methylase
MDVPAVVLARPADVSRLLVKAYPLATGVSALLIRWRPYICPFHEIIRFVPFGSSFLDVGCGVGLMSVLLMHSGRAKSVVGIDTSATAVETARRAVLPGNTVGSFRRLSLEDSWPEDRFDGAICLDVLHHIPFQEQRNFVRRLSRLNFTGKIIFKDVSPRPFWKALASKIHDLLISRQWIHIRDENEVRKWFESEGLSVTEYRRLNMLWYSHYLPVVERAQR